MEKEAAALYSLLVAENVLVRFGDLAPMMAAAQFPGDTERASLHRAVAEENIAQQLGRMVASAELTVRNRHGMTRLDGPHGQQLRDAVMIPTVDLAPLRAAFGIGIRFIPQGSGPTLWTIENAAAALAAQLGWHDAARDTLRAQMLDAGHSGALEVRHPHTDLPVTLHERATVRDFYELVTRDDVNAWLAGIGAPYRWVTNERGAALVLPTPAEVVSPNATTQRRWTNERLEQLRAYREQHGTTEAARHFGVSTSRVRALLPAKKAAPKGYSVFAQRQK